MSTEGGIDWEYTLHVRESNFKFFMEQLDQRFAPGSNYYGDRFTRAQAEYQEKAKPLEQLLATHKSNYDSEVERIKRDKTEFNMDIERSLSVNPYRRTSEWYSIIPRAYFTDLDFGFCLEDAIILARYALTNNLSPEFFVAWCQNTRSALVSAYQGSMDPKHNLFDPDIKERSEAEEMASEYAAAINILGPSLAAEKSAVIEQAKLHFRKIRGILDAISEPPVPDRKRVTLNGFLDFMRSDQALIFANPVRQKLAYESQFTEARKLAKLSLWTSWDHDRKDTEYAYKLMKITGLPFEEVSSDAVSLDVNILPSFRGIDGIYRAIDMLVPGAIDLYRRENDFTV